MFEPAPEALIHKWIEQDRAFCMARKPPGVDAGAVMRSLNRKYDAVRRALQTQPVERLNKELRYWITAYVEAGEDMGDGTLHAELMAPVTAGMRRILTLLVMNRYDAALEALQRFCSIDGVDEACIPLELDFTELYWADVRELAVAFEP